MSRNSTTLSKHLKHFSISGIRTQDVQNNRGIVSVLNRGFNLIIFDRSLITNMLCQNVFNLT